MPFVLANRTVRLTDTDRRVGTGWVPPMFDPRDYTDRHPKVSPVVDMLAEHLRKHKSKALTAPPPAVDLRQWCSPIENQEQLGSCTAHATVGIVEYFQRRSFGKHLDGSRLFVYKATRNLMGVTGDTGAWLRNAMGAIVACGIPTERYWAYNIADFDVEPPPFVYAVANNFEAVRYFCHDPQAAHVPPVKVVESVKAYASAGIPSMFGFWGYVSFDQGEEPGSIPLPSDEELDGDPEWGHAIVVVGYDDEKKITNGVTGASTTGAFLIRNSWGKTWGQLGYGWFPYEYVLRSAAMDFWSLIKMEWVDTDQFY